MKRSVLLIAVFAIAQCVAAQDWARAKVEKSPRHHEWVTVKHDDRSVETFVAYPESKDKRPVVLVIHEIFGMTDWVQNLADELADILGWVLVMAHDQGIDLGDAVRKKLKKNAAKYPVEKARGVAKKYTEL